VYSVSTHSRIHTVDAAVAAAVSAETSLAATHSLPVLTLPTIHQSTTFNRAAAQHDKQSMGIT